MSKKTRGRLDLKPLRELVGPSNPLPENELATLRDVLAAGMFLKESLNHVKEMSSNQFAMNLTDQVLAVYHKANSQFKPGTILITQRAISEKIQNAWKKAMSMVQKKTKVNKDSREFMNKMDRLFNLFYCKCGIVSCLDEGCKDDCIQGAHSICSCPRVNRIPPLELPFVKDQKEKVGRGGMGIAGVDQDETKRLQGQMDRKKKTEEGLVNMKVKSLISRSSTQIVDPADNDVVDDSDNDQDCNMNIKKVSSQNRLSLTNLARESLRCGASVRLTASLATALLIDLNIVTKENASLIIDPNKIQRAREKIMREERIEADEKLGETVLQVVFFDERKDKTKMLVVDEDGEEFARTIDEAHYTLTDPHNYLTHLTPEEGTGAKGTAEVILNWLDEVDQLENVQILGGDSTNSMTGWVGWWSNSFN